MLVSAAPAAAVCLLALQQPQPLEHCWKQMQPEAAPLRMQQPLLRVLLLLWALPLLLRVLLLLLWALPLLLLLLRVRL